MSQRKRRTPRKDNTDLIGAGIDAVAWAVVALIFLMLILMTCAGCVVNKPSISIARAEIGEFDASVRSFSGGSTVNADASTSATLTINANHSGAGGASGWLSTVWGMVREWFGVAKQ